MSPAAVDGHTLTNGDSHSDLSDTCHDTDWFVLDRSLVLGVAEVKIVILLGMFAIAVLLVWTIRDPGGAWWRTEGWAHKHPDMHEPSAANYRVRRVQAVIGLLILLPVMIYVLLVL